jgi:ketosteroid isomerase-like protein
MGKPVHALGTGTMVLEKRGDGWAIVHVHWSSRKLR